MAPEHEHDSPLRRLLRWDVTVAVLLVAVLAGGGLTTPGFASGGNLAFLVQDMTEVGLIALAMTLLVVAAEVDLSVASVLGLSSALMGALWAAGWAIEVIIPVVILVGGVCGLVNGLLVTKLGLPSLAVTIGTMAAYRGLALVVLGDQAIADFPPRYTELGAGTIGGTPVPYTLVVYALLATAAVVTLHATGLGRALVAMGANQEAAFFAGIRVKRIKLWLFALSGLVAGLAGVVYTLRYSSARADNGLGMELTVIAAVLLGGVDFDGGKGTLGGVIASVFLLGALRNLLTLHDVSTEIQTVLTGTLLVLSVLVPRLGAIARDAARPRRPSAEPAGAGTRPADASGSAPVHVP